MFALFLGVTAAFVTLSLREEDSVRSTGRVLLGVLTLMLGVRLADSVAPWPTWPIALCSAEESPAEPAVGSSDQEKSPAPEKVTSEAAAETPATTDSPASEAPSTGNEGVPAASESAGSEADTTTSKPGDAPTRSSTAEAPDQEAERAAPQVPDAQESTPNSSPEAAKPSEADPAVESESTAPKVEAEGQPGPAGLSHDLSSEPKIYIPPGRPSWVESLPNRESDVHTLWVTSEPHARRRDCEKALDEELALAVSDYVNDYLDSQSASTFIRFGIREIRKRFVKPENIYHETIFVSFGPMQQAHALLEFDADFRKELDDRWSRLQATKRLFEASLGAAGILVVLGVAFGYFRLDTATKGYYTGRLQFAAVAAILTVAAAGAIVGSHFSDLLVYVVP